MRRLLVVCLVLIAACSTKSPSPTTTPRPTRTATPKVDAHSVEVKDLLRPGTSEQATVYGDMDGDGVDEIAVWSRANKAPAEGPLAQSYVDVFADRAGAWTNIYDATKHGVIQTGEDFVSQTITFMRFVPFGCDRSSEFVLGVQTQGAGEGPLDVWVLSPKKTEFHYTTTSGGTLTVDPHKGCGDSGLILTTGDFRPGDAMCCPSAIATIRIEQLGDHVGISSRSNT
jgi:hypothetical protein